MDVKKVLVTALTLGLLAAYIPSGLAGWKDQSVWQGYKDQLAVEKTEYASAKSDAQGAQGAYRAEKNADNREALKNAITVQIKELLDTTEARLIMLEYWIASVPAMENYSYKTSPDQISFYIDQVQKKKNQLKTSQMGLPGLAQFRKEAIFLHTRALRMSIGRILTETVMRGIDKIKTAVDVQDGVADQLGVPNGHEIRESINKAYQLLDRALGSKDAALNRFLNIRTRQADLDVGGAKQDYADGKALVDEAKDWIGKAAKQAKHTNRLIRAYVAEKRGGGSADGGGGGDGENPVCEGDYVAVLRSVGTWVCVLPQGSTYFPTPSGESRPTCTNGGLAYSSKSGWGCECSGDFDQLVPKGNNSFECVYIGGSQKITSCSGAGCLYGQGGYYCDSAYKPVKDGSFLWCSACADGFNRFEDGNCGACLDNYNFSDGKCFFMAYEKTCSDGSLKLAKLRDHHYKWTCVCPSDAPNKKCTAQKTCSCSTEENPVAKECPTIKPITFCSGLPGKSWVCDTETGEWVCQTDGE